MIRLGIITVLVALGGGLHGVAEPSRAQGEQVYLALGDSIPAGLSSSLPAERSYPAILRELMLAERVTSDAPSAVELVNLAEPGETTESFLQEGQLDAALERIQGTDELRTVTLTLGGNDILALQDASDGDREAALDQFSESYGQVIDELAGALEGMDVDVVVTAYYDLTDGDPSIEGSDAWWLARFNDVIRETAGDAGFAVVDLAELFDGRISELTWHPADVHPNNQGHQVIGRAIWQQLDYDDDAPSVEITRPEPGEARSRTPTIHATGDDVVGTENVDVYVDDEHVAELLYVSDRDAWVGIWNAREYESDEAEITVIATDLAGNEGSDTVDITLPPARGTSEG